MNETFTMDLSTDQLVSSTQTIFSGGSITTSIISVTNMTTSDVSNDLARYNECSSEIPACQAQKYLFLIIAPILVVMSTVGNSLGLAVMQRKALRDTATAVFISSLAVSDTVAVWTGLSRHFVKKLTTYDIRQYSVWTCRFQRFILYLSLDTSAWILAAISIERFLAVCMPLKHKTLGVRARAWKVVIGILIFQAAFNCHVFFTYGESTYTVNNKTETYACSFSSEAARTYLTVYHSYVALAIYCLLPSCVMLILNICIIRRLFQIQKTFLRNASTTSRSRINTLSMTKMLLCITFYFITITTPSFIFAIFQESLFEGAELTPERIGEIELVDAVLTLMLYLNHSINFFLYCATGNKFKRELRMMLGCNRSKKDKHTVFGEVTMSSGTPLMTRNINAARNAAKADTDNHI